MNKISTKAALSGLLDRTVTFASANSLWYSQQFKLQAPFVEKNTTYFDATVQGLDFDSPKAKDAMNGWVKAKTKGKIEDIIEEVNSDNVMFLINAIYFKGAWKQQFNKQLTQTAPFYQANGSQVAADFMVLQNGQYTYYFDSTKQVIDLPYGNGQFSMTLIIPDPSTTIAGLVPELNSANLNAWLTAGKVTNIPLHLPRFKLEYKKKLKETLIQMGMEDAFIEGQANFSQMVQGLNRGDLFIDEVYHKSFLEVDEEGTEAAAATSVGMATRISSPQFINVVNRPFVFVIREKSTNAILFIGQLMTP